ncbi:MULTISPECIES: VOC family protein [unclassified Streptomyces]|uniref:VOC family protein n=1 Tax=unclassified Streptomyces TaxID=2593676 RepID=UPI001902FE9B|nr:VOC family protein [Streptomyces sp. HSG2]
MDILGATLRVYVDDLDRAIPFYEGLAGTEALRFERGGVEAAAVGCFLVMSGAEAQLELLRKISATVAVTDVEEAGHRLGALGAEIVAGPMATPAGRSLVARHPDGAVYEYVDRRESAVRAQR